MPTPAEHRALLFVAAVAALGVGVRGLRAVRGSDVPASDRAALAQQIANVDSVLAVGGRRRSTPAAAKPAGRPPAVPARGAEPRPPVVAPADRARVDLDVADSAALEALPGIGPALAARIVADREARGPFGSLAALERVRGIGPALARRVQPYVTFSLPPRPTDAEHSAPVGGRRP
ncbi:MAG: helix-hairpin-helix domain-containing protein [Gemmatimonadota bacterium]|nr:helix-hairpin-helix domain-containing protein [Gemmatimonadota bacterium]